MGLAHVVHAPAILLKNLVKLSSRSVIFNYTAKFQFSRTRGLVFFLREYFRRLSLTISLTAEKVLFSSERNLICYEKKNRFLLIIYGLSCHMLYRSYFLLFP